MWSWPCENGQPHSIGTDALDEITATAGQWALLEEHFRYHAALVDRFKNADSNTVVRMWANRTNEAGEHLSQFEFDALVERYCELFGNWPGRG